MRAQHGGHRPGLAITDRRDPDWAAQPRRRHLDQLEPIELRREVGYAIRAVFGYNIVGRMASDLANSAMSGVSFMVMAPGGFLADAGVSRRAG